MVETPWLAADTGRAAARARESFAAAASRAPCHALDVLFGGARLRLELAGDAARATFSTAFEVAPADGVAPDLTLFAWDAAHGAPLAPPEADREAPIRVGRHFTTGGGEVAGHARRAVFWEPPWIYGYDLGERVAWFFCPDAGAMPAWSRSQPFLRLLHAWLRTRGRLIAHGAVIGRGGRGLLLTAPGGSGKSTLAIAGKLAGWDYLGDDYVAVEPPAEDGGGARAFGLYRVAKLDPAHMARHLPEAGTHALDAPREGDKVLLSLPLTPAPAGSALAAIVVPRVAPAGSALRRIGGGEALRALAPSTLMQLPGDGAGDFATLARVARGLPAYHLDIGPRLGDALALLAPLVEQPA